MSWMREVGGPLTDEQQSVVDGLGALVARLEPRFLDHGASSAAADDNGLHISLVHRTRPDLGIAIEAAGYGEIVVSYGPEHEHFRPDDASVGRVWPFATDDHVHGALQLVEYLLTGRVELHVWLRPLGVKTRSFWIDDEGKAELFLRGSTVGPFFGWSREPEIRRFDFTAG